jgi:hypothetical protein
MPIIFQCTCGKALRAGPEVVGKKTKCPTCGAVLTIPGGPNRPAEVAASSGAVAAITVPAPGPAPGNAYPLASDLDWTTLVEAPTLGPTAAPADARPPSIQMAAADPAGDDPPRPEDGTKQYRVLGQKDQGFSGKFSPSGLEQTLNLYARRGWCLRAAASLTIPGHAGSPAHEELIVILER